jgi:uncharacterized protein YigE (DUF2233 family)
MLLAKLLYRSIMLVCFIVSLVQPTYATEKLSWQSLAPGFDYAKIDVGTHFLGRIHAFRIDTQHYHFRVALARDHNLNYANAKQFQRYNNALLAINGGFFSPDADPLGLRISEGKQLTPLKNTSWWGIFTLDKYNQANVHARKNFYPQRDTQFAVQAGPRLVVNGYIPKLRDNEKQRSAIGVTPSGNVILAITENAAMTTTMLAEIMRRSQAQGGLGCINALNLDGGSSSQLFVKVADFSLSIPSLRGVSDAIIISKK